VLPADATVDVEQLAAAVAQAETAADAGDVERAVQAAVGRREHCGARLPDRRQRLGGPVARSECTTCACGPRSRVRPRHLTAGSSGRAVDAARDALALDPAREAAFRPGPCGTLAAAGERGEALRVWERCRITLVEELGVDPAPETEAVYLENPGRRRGRQRQTCSRCRRASSPSFSPTSWSRRRCGRRRRLPWRRRSNVTDAIVGEVVAAHGGTLLKSKLEGDATVSVFARATEGATAALAVLAALASGSWPTGKEPRVRMAMHTGEAFERGGD
jgi:hypothetical protein